MQLFDIIGPVMIGPSSSHTAGAARIGRITRMLLGEEVQYADIRFHGSFAKTWEGHGTDRAVIGGLLGLQVDDERLRKSRALAEQAGMRYTISAVQLRDAHPNTVLIDAVGVSGAQISVQAVSVGGGSIRVLFGRAHHAGHSASGYAGGHCQGEPPAGCRAAEYRYHACIPRRGRRARCDGAGAG